MNLWKGRQDFTLTRVQIHGADNARLMQKCGQQDLNLNSDVVVVRLPGFEPGSSTWQAEVLNQARLQPHVHTFGWYTTLPKII